MIWGAAGGLFGGVGAMLVYRALAIGPVSVASPIFSITGLGLPVIVGLALGERPSWVALSGLALSPVAIVLLGRGTPTGPGAAHDPRRAVVPSLTAGAGARVLPGVPGPHRAWCGPVAAGDRALQRSARCCWGNPVATPAASCRATRRAAGPSRPGDSIRWRISPTSPRCQRGLAVAGGARWCRSHPRPPCCWAARCSPSAGADPQRAGFCCSQSPPRACISLGVNDVGGHRALRHGRLGREPDRAEHPDVVERQVVQRVVAAAGATMPAPMLQWNSSGLESVLSARSRATNLAGSQ